MAIQKMVSFREYIEYAQRYIDRSRGEQASYSIEWLLPAIILSWTAIESFINNMIDDFSKLPDDMFELHERAFLLEQRVRFVDHGNELGNFVLEGNEYHTLENKIYFLMAKFGESNGSFKGEPLWQDFEELKDTRNKIIHPRRDNQLAIDVDKAEKSLETAKNIIQFVSRNVWSNPVVF